VHVNASKLIEGNALAANFVILENALILKLNKFGVWPVHLSQFNYDESIHLRQHDQAFTVQIKFKLITIVKISLFIMDALV
jgi:hypothetical protein